VDNLENIIRLFLRQSNYEMPLPEVDNEFTNRAAYQEGRFTSDVDMSIYQCPSEDNDTGG
jgi:hypothetical protein